MFKSLAVSFCAILCLIDLGVFALDCLKCYSNDPQSACRLGSRKNKPKIDSCVEQGARCYAIGILHPNSTGVFERGCTSEPNFCETNADAEFCNSCGFNYCNYAVMELKGYEDPAVFDDEASNVDDEALVQGKETEYIEDKSVEQNRVTIRRKLFRTLKDKEEDRNTSN